MLQIDYKLKIGTFNAHYEKVYNCRAVKPIHEDKNGFYNDTFALDKRRGMERLYGNNRYNFLDMTTINGINYYYVKEGSKVFIGTIKSDKSFVIMSPKWDITDNSPQRFIRTRGAYGSILYEGTITTATASTDKITGASNRLNLDSNGYIKIPHGGQTKDKGDTGDFITFRTGILAGGTNEILFRDDTNWYIIGTNTRGTLPIANDTYYITSGNVQGSTITVGVKEGVIVNIINGQTDSKQIKILDSEIQDIVLFNDSVFIMAKNTIYYSRSTFDDNTQIYPLDFFRFDFPYCFVPLGKNIIAFSKYSDRHKIINIVTTDSNNIDYIMYGLNYSNELYSRYSYVYTDSSLMLLQKNKQLISVTIKTINQTTYEIIPDYVTKNVRSIFDDFVGDNVRISVDNKFLHFINFNQGKTIVIEFDKEYNQWLLHKYDYELNLIDSDIILYNGGVATRGGYNDLGNDYEQEINFSINGDYKIYQLGLVRTLFGLFGQHSLGLELDVQTHLGPHIYNTNIKYNNDIVNYSKKDQYKSSGQIIGQQQPSSYTYNGTTLSVQNKIGVLARFSEFKFHSKNRFIYGGSIILGNEAKPLVNEIYN